MGNDTITEAGEREDEENRVDTVKQERDIFEQTLDRVIAKSGKSGNGQC